MKNKIKILLVDDHVVVRAGFRMLLSSADTMEVVAEAAKSEEACRAYVESNPDVVVMDLSMPGIGGLEGIRRLIARDPEAKILVFSIHNEAVYVNRALAAGAKGYIGKNSAPDILVTAIHILARGGSFIESGLKNGITAKVSPGDLHSLTEMLTAREFDVFCLLAKGLTTQETARELCLGTKTVANYSTIIKAKLNIGTNAELARLAMTLKII